MFGHIYEISDGNKKYIGSTISPLPIRFKNHKMVVNTGQYPKNKFYNYMREVSIDKFSISVLREGIKQEDLKANEQEFINQVSEELRLNTHKAYVTTHSYLADTKLYQRLWRKLKANESHNLEFLRLSLIEI